MVVSLDVQVRWTGVRFPPAPLMKLTYCHPKPHLSLFSPYLITEDEEGFVYCDENDNAAIAVPQAWQCVDWRTDVDTNEILG